MNNTDYEFNFLIRYVKSTLSDKKVVTLFYSPREPKYHLPLKTEKG